MIGRWFAATYAVSVLTGFATAEWAFPNAVPGVIGLLYLAFALPFVLVASLVGWAMQVVIERQMAAGWARTAILACGAAIVGGVGMALMTRTPLYVVIAVFSAASGAVVTQHDAAWRSGWLVVLLAVGIATLLGVGVVANPS